MTKEEFENMAEDKIINEGDFYSETPHLGFYQAYDFCQVVCDENEEWLYAIVANKDSSEIEIIELQ